MKKVIFLITVMWMAFAANAAFVTRMPIVRIQPNGDTLHCFVTGDEFYHRLHDAEGYTIIQDHTNGWYVYAQRQWNSDHSDWQLVATTLIAGQSNPAAAGLTPNLIASRSTVDRLHKQWEIPAQYRIEPSPGAKSGANNGTLNNVVIFIRFADDSEIETPFSTIDNMFNDTADDAISMYNYFWNVSYGQLQIPTHFYPAPNNNQVISYQDSLSRNRFLPYDSVTNPSGYQDDDERRDLEFGLLQRAVNYVNQHSPVPSNLNIDHDNDGMVDNICFVVKGTYTGWNDLLWPHKWSLYDRYVYLNGKRVYTFNLQLEGSGSHYFSASTFCHEMFHTLGAPDLYHYYNYTNISSVGIWDLMCNNTTPPQHMGMYMKMRYGQWLDTVPEITEGGTYSLHSVSHSSNNCYRIKGGRANQWYYLEYRNNNDLFDAGLPGSGLLIYRIDSRYNGCSGFDAQSQFDEVYIFRPGGDNDVTNGTVSQAFFSAQSGRTTFAPTTDPFPWLTGNEIDTTITITNIGMAGDSITFTYIPNRPEQQTIDSASCALTVIMRDSWADTWNGAYLTFETTDGQPIASLSMGDCRSIEQKSVAVGNEPVVVRWESGVAPSECGYTIRLGDGSMWTNVDNAGSSGIVGTIATPCQLDQNTYTVTVQSNDAHNNVSNGGTVTSGSAMRIHAYPAEHYQFKGWHDGAYHGAVDDTVLHSTEQHRTVTILSDTVFTAIFEAERFNIFVSVNDESMGSATGQGSYAYGDTATLEARPNNGYSFDHWQYGSFTFTDNPLQVAVYGNAGYVAHFVNLNSINEGSDALSIARHGLVVTLNGAAGQAVAVYDVMGRTVSSVAVASEGQQFVMPHEGLYIIRTESGWCRKVVVAQ